MAGGLADRTRRLRTPAAAGNVTSSTDADNNVTANVYNGNEVTSSSVVNGSVTISSEQDTYDADGNVLTSADAAGNVTSNTYRGSELIQTSQLNATSATLNATYASYDANGNLASSTDGVDNITSNFFNGNELTSSYVLSSSSVTISSENDTYDADGNLLTRSDGQGNVTTNVYDGNELVSTAVVHSLSITLSSAHNSYDSDGNLLTTTNAEGNVTTNVYNGDDRVISSTVATSSGTVNSSVAYTYDADGKVLTTTDGDGNVTTNSWDGNLLRRATVTSASGTTVGVTYYSYDSNGNLTSVTDPDGRTILSTYRDNQLVSQTWQNADNAVANVLSWSYDSAGNLISASNNAGTYSISYNGHELVSESGPNGVTLNYGYDAAGHVNSIVDSQGGTTSLTYGANGEVLTETYQDASNHFRVNYTYDAAGNVLAETRYSDLAGTSEVGFTQNGYNGDEITSINQQNGSGTVLASYSYSYDNGGWLTSKVQNGVTTGYGYNADGELTLAGTQSYSYDQNGNPTEAGDSIGANNELLSDGTWKYSYDAAGNMTGQVGISNGLTWSYGYDDANEMTSAVETNSGGTIVEQGIYVYDVLGNRIEEVSMVSGTTTDQRYVYGADGTLYADQNGSNTITTRYVADTPMGVNHWQAAVSTSTGVNWLLSDYQGSVCDVVNNSGTLLCVTVDDAFGNITSQTNASNAGRLGFQDGQTDIVTGWNHFDAREYDSSTGRWNRIDPEGFAAGQSNLYEFAGNGPTDGTDPTGRQELAPIPRGAAEVVLRLVANPAELAAATSGYETVVGIGMLGAEIGLVGVVTVGAGSVIADAMKLSEQNPHGIPDEYTQFEKHPTRKVTITSLNQTLALAKQVGLSRGEIDGVVHQGRLINADDDPNVYIIKDLNTLIDQRLQLIRVIKLAKDAGVPDVDIKSAKTTDVIIELIKKFNLIKVAKQLGATDEEIRRSKTNADLSDLAYKYFLIKLAKELEIPKTEIDKALPDLGKLQQLVLETDKNQRRQRTLKACFAAGTLLYTPEGYRPIESFRIGDELFSRSEYDPTSEVSAKPVEEVFVSTGQIFILKVNGKTIRTTGEHPFWVRDQGWVNACQLVAGNQLSSHDGEWVAIESVENTGKFETVYNLRVADYSTYFVGHDEWGFSVWAHNACIVLYRYNQGKGQPDYMQHWSIEISTDGDESPLNSHQDNDARGMPRGNVLNDYLQWTPDAHVVILDRPGPLGGGYRVIGTYRIKVDNTQALAAMAEVRRRVVAGDYRWRLRTASCFTYVATILRAAGRRDIPAPADNNETMTAILEALRNLGYAE